MSEQVSKTQSKEQDLPRWLNHAHLIAIALMVIAFSYYFFHFSGTSADQEKFGQFGDFVGGVLNPLFAFLAFILLLSTLRLQNRELQNSSRELANSAEALKLQNEALALQNFESTFFQMLRRISNLATQTKYHAAEGREAFKGLYVEQLKEIHNNADKLFDRKKTINKVYEEFYKSTRSELGHYFRSLYHVFAYIDRSNLTDYDKSVYASMARAQLSTYELALLFYNGLVGEGEKGFKPLIEKYGILKHVDTRDLLNGSDIDNEDLYHRNAFLGREDR